MKRKIQKRGPDGMGLNIVQAEFPLSDPIVKAADDLLRRVAAKDLPTEPRARATFVRERVQSALKGLPTYLTIDVGKIVYSPDGTHFTLKLEVLLPGGVPEQVEIYNQLRSHLNLPPIGTRFRETETRNRSEFEVIGMRRGASHKVMAKRVESGKVYLWPYQAVRRLCGLTGPALQGAK